MTNICILHVEDDDNDIFLLQSAFKRAGITNPVKVATDGQMAIDYLAGTELLPIAKNIRCPAWFYWT